MYLESKKKTGYNIRQENLKCELYDLCTKVRDIFEKHYKEFDKDLFLDEFPSGTCGTVSNILGIILQRHGYGVFNYVWGRAYCPVFSTHAWLEKDGIICDITADQFGEDYPKVYVGYENEFYKRFVNENPSHPFNENGYINVLERDCSELIEEYI